MKINGEFVLRDILGETILVPVGETALQMNGMISLDPVAALIWKGIESGKNCDEILTEILDQYDVDVKTAKDDLAEFLDQLRGKGFLVD